MEIVMKVVMVMVLMVVMVVVVIVQCQCALGLTLGRLSKTKLMQAVVRTPAVTANSAHDQIPVQCNCLNVQCLLRVSAPLWFGFCDLGFLSVSSYGSVLQLQGLPGGKLLKV